jgi:CBS domain-containing protein
MKELPMFVQDVMVQNVKVCRPEENLATVAGRLWDERCGALPVVDERNRVLSMITDRDIAIALGTRDVKASAVKVGQVSLPRVFTCGPKEEVHHALRTMVSQNVRRLPVVDVTDRLLGILSIDDLLGEAIAPEELASALRKIMEKRTRGAAHDPADVVSVANV